MEFKAFERLDRARNVARIRNQNCVAASARDQQIANGESKDVIQRKRAHRDQLFRRLWLFRIV